MPEHLTEPMFGAQPPPYVPLKGEGSLTADKKRYGSVRGPAWVEAGTAPDRSIACGLAARTRGELWRLGRPALFRRDRNRVRRRGAPKNEGVSRRCRELLQQAQLHQCWVRADQLRGVGQAPKRSRFTAGPLQRRLALLLRQHDLRVDLLQIAREGDVLQVHGLDFE